MAHGKTGILLVNVGTPEAPTPRAVGRYLRQFLMDPQIINLPAPIRWFLVNALIVPRRSHASAALYKKIWRKEGSPLFILTEQLAQKVQASLGPEFSVRIGMRYGSPSILQELRSFEHEKVNRLIVVPMYPQYSRAATDSCEREVRRCWKKVKGIEQILFFPEFFDSPFFIDPSAERVEQEWKTGQWDHLLLTFHGLPEHQMKSEYPEHCLKNETCCALVTQKNAHCYRAQSYATARALVKKLGIPSEKTSVGFQSRLKGRPWIQPFSDHLYESLPKKGVKKLLVVAPSFTTDCLETLEEVAIRGKEAFVHAGGEDLKLVPCVNADDSWAKGLAGAISKVAQDSLLNRE